MAKFSFLESIVKEDLGNYGQHNPCPMSLTVINERHWRHYELGAIYGFVIYNDFIIYNGEEEERWLIASVKEDDEYWYAPDGPMDISAFWIEAVDKTWQRIVQWAREHLREGWFPGGDLSNPKEYRKIIIKPIVPEIIPWPKNEGPDNAVLGTKFCTITKD